MSQTQTRYHGAALRAAETRAARENSAVKVGRVDLAAVERSHAAGLAVTRHARHVAAVARTRAPLRFAPFAGLALAVSP